MQVHGVAIVVHLWLLVQGALAESNAKKPNILFLFTDDQDLLLGSLNYMDVVTRNIRDQGVAFENHYATVALCCPSRVALLRGQHAHNTNVTDVAAPGGGYDKFRLSGESSDYLPHWLSKAGYRTEYIGKLMNQYGYYNYWYKPEGWDHFDGLLDPYTYIYNTPIFSLNGDRPKLYTKQHQTDVLRAKAVDRLTNLTTNPDQSWFLAVATVAPHQQFNSSGRWPPVPATRHENLFPGLKAPRSPNFNPKVQKKPSWVGELPYMDDASIAFSDDTYRRRAQALQGVDELIQNLLNLLEEKRILNETVIVFSADHGYHVGNHRIPAGKTLPYREDTHVPFFIRGPGIPEGFSTRSPSSHVDLAPTFLELAGLEKSAWPEFLDGRSLVQYWNTQRTCALSEGEQSRFAPETINIEYWGSSLVEASGLNITAADPRNSYKTLRIVGEDYGYLYSHWCTDETELYDTITDPYELEPLDLQENAKLANRLNGLLLVTKACERGSCRDPWKLLHPAGNVSNLAEALDYRYDEYYSSLPQVSFKECLAYQLRSNEEPFFPLIEWKVTFGEQYRNKSATDGLATSVSGQALVPEDGHWGAVYQNLSVIEQSARYLTDQELGLAGEKRLIMDNVSKRSEL